VKTLIIIPSFNDATRLKHFLPTLNKILPQHFNITVIDDGSHPKEKEDLQTLIKTSQEEWEKTGKNLSLISRTHNIGKGGSIQEGWKTPNSADILGFTDADGAVGAEEILRAENFFRQSDYQALFGSRIQLLGRHINRSFKRHISSRVFATLVTHIGKLPAYDTQCGLKFLKKQAYQTLEPYFQSKRFAFDVELALLLQKFSLHTIEFPVDWSDIPGSKVSLINDSLKMGKEVFEIKKRIDKIPTNKPVNPQVHKQTHTATLTPTPFSEN
jgi:dolichyl-phosphate beta-glucosyltransferase